MNIGVAKGGSCGSCSLGPRTAKKIIGSVVQPVNLTASRFMAARVVVQRFVFWDT